jgi:L-fuconolactonase
MSSTWLNLVAEDPILPEVPICDAHHHLWDGTSTLYPGDVYMGPDLTRDARSGHNVVSTVFVDCLSGYLENGPEELRPTGETTFAAAVAKDQIDHGGPRLGGIVSHADITLGSAIRPVLERHIAVGNGLFRGIRYATASDPHPDVRGNHINAARDALDSEPFHESLSVLASMDLTFDAWVYHHQLPQVARAAALVPDATIVVDHLGGPLGMGPYVGDASVRPLWRENLSMVAAQRNTYVKLGGIAMPSMGADWMGGPRPATSTELAERWADDIEFAVRIFGSERCLFESNFPVDRQNASYVVLWNAFKRISADWSDDDRRRTFHDTAVAVYSIE